MQLFTVEIENENLKFCLLELKEGQTAMTFDGREIGTGYLGIMNINSDEEVNSYTERWKLGIWESIEKYKGYMQKLQYCEPVNSFGMRFNGSSDNTIPVATLNYLIFNDSWLFHREITTNFLNIILMIPEIGERWQIVT